MVGYLLPGKVYWILTWDNSADFLAPVSYNTCDQSVSSTHANEWNTTLSHHKLPQHKRQKELGTRQLFPGMHASTYPQTGKRPGSSPSADPSAIPATQTSKHRNQSPLSPRKVPDSINLSLKINESKWHLTTLMSRGNPVCRPVGEASLCLRNKGSFCDIRQQV